MAERFNHNATMRGTFGKAWINGERLANIRSFEAKASIDYEDMDINGDFGQKKRYMGYSISGTMTLFKVDSLIINKYKNGVMTGELPDIKIVAALDDPTAYGAERVALYDVKFDEITLMAFENKTLVEEEVPFTAGSYEFLDTVG